MVEMALFNVQRAITPKVCKPELRFMCSARRLMMLYVCMTFHQTSGTVFNLQSEHAYIVKMAIFNIYYVQRAATIKVG